MLICGRVFLGVLDKIKKISTENDNLHNLVESQQKKMIAQLNLLNERKKVEEGDYISILSLNNWDLGWTGKVKRVVSNSEEHVLMIEFDFSITFYGFIEFNKYVQIAGIDDRRIIHFLTFQEINRLQKIAGKSSSPANMATK